MQKRSVRIVVLVLLLGIGGGAAVETSGVQRRLDSLRSGYSELSNRIERLHGAITFIAAAQNTYIGSGHPDEPLLNRVSVLIQQVANDTGDVRTRMRAPNSPSHLQAFADGLAELVKADARAREHFLEGQALAAADTVFREARGSVEVMEAKLREFRYAEAAVFDAETLRLEARRLWTVSGVAVLWVLGLIGFTPLRSRTAIVPEAEPVPEQATPVTVQPQAASIDLTEAADVCTAISRLIEAAQLPSLLARITGLLDAPGLIVWLSAGEELFAAAAHGYDAGTLALLGPISRGADNATAAAWRSGELNVVPRTDDSNGAIVVPMFGTNGCLGVLALELRGGRESDTATRAVTTMIAAQLAAVLSAWPAASSSSERHAAVS